jgi:hypothetical protein
MPQSISQECGPRKIVGKVIKMEAQAPLFVEHDVSNVKNFPWQKRKKVKRHVRQQSSARLVTISAGVARPLPPHWNTTDAPRPIRHGANHQSADHFTNDKRRGLLQAQIAQAFCHLIRGKNGGRQSLANVGFRFAKWGEWGWIERSGGLRGDRTTGSRQTVGYWRARTCTGGEFRFNFHTPLLSRPRAAEFQNIQSRSVKPHGWDLFVDSSTVPNVRPRLPRQMLIAQVAAARNQNAGTNGQKEKVRCVLAKTCAFFWRPSSRRPNHEGRGNDGKMMKCLGRAIPFGLRQNPGSDDRMMQVARARTSQRRHIPRHVSLIRSAPRVST